MMKFGKLFVLTLAVLFGFYAVKPSVSKAQTTTTVGKRALTSAWKHVPPNPDMRVMGLDGKPLFIGYTIVDDGGSATFTDNAKGTPLGDGESDQAEIVAAETFTKRFRAQSDDTCLWDATGSLTVPGIGVPNTDNDGTFVKFTFTPRKFGKPIVLSLSVIQNGKLVQIFRVPGLRSVFDSYPKGVPFDRPAGPGLLKTKEMLWVAVPMSPGDDPVFMDSGSFGIEVTRAPNASGEASWLFGYTVTMGLGCDILPPPTLCVHGANWLSPQEILWHWCGSCDYVVWTSSTTFIHYNNRNQMNMLMRGNGLMPLSGVLKLQAYYGAGWISLNKFDCNGLEWACIFNGDLAGMYGVSNTYGLTTVGDWFTQTAQVLNAWRQGKPVDPIQVQHLNEIYEQMYN